MSEFNLGCRLEMFGSPGFVDHVHEDDGTICVQFNDGRYFRYRATNPFLHPVTRDDDE